MNAVTIPLQDLVYSQEGFCLRLRTSLKELELIVAWNGKNVTREFTDIPVGIASKGEISWSLFSLINRGVYRFYFRASKAYYTVPDSFILGEGEKVVEFRSEDLISGAVRQGGEKPLPPDIRVRFQDRNKRILPWNTSVPRGTILGILVMNPHQEEFRLRIDVEDRDGKKMEIRGHRHFLIPGNSVWKICALVMRNNGLRVNVYAAQTINSEVSSWTFILES